MIEEKEIKIDTDFGDVRLKVKEIMDQKNLNMNRVSKMTGLKFDVVSNYYHNKIHIYHGDILAKLCYILDCNIEDIIEYSKDEKD